MSHRPPIQTVDCRDADWKWQLSKFLSEGADVTLTNLDQVLNTNHCDGLSVKHRVSLRIDFQKNEAYFQHLRS